MTRSLCIELFDAAPTAPDAEPTVPVARAQSLSSEEAAALFDGMEDLPAPPDTTFFARPETLPPALSQATIQTVFDPVADLRPVQNVGPLRVDLCTPRGTSTPVHQILIAFSRPVVRLGDDLDSQGVSVEPAVHGRWRWVDTMTLVFEPAQTLMPGSTAYKVHVPALTSFDGQVLENPQSFEFSTPTLGLRAGYPTTTQTPGTRPLVVLRFDQDINPRLVFEALKPNVAFELLSAETLSDEIRDEIREHIPDAKNWRENTWVALRPADPLPAATTIRLEIPSKSRACDRPLLTESPLVFEFQTAQAFEIEKSHGSGENPDVWWSIRFSNQIDFSSFKNSEIIFDPPFSASVSGYGDTLNISGRRNPKTTYTVTLPENTCDIHGQKISGKRVLKFKTTQAEANLQGPSGTLLTLPRHLKPALTLQSLENKKVGVEIYRVNAENYREFSEELHPIRWNGKKPPGSLLGERILEASDASRWQELEVDLASSFENSDHLVLVIRPKINPLQAVKNAIMRQREMALVYWVQRSSLGVTTSCGDLDGHALVTRLEDASPVAGAKIVAETGPASLPTDASGKTAWTLGPLESFFRVLHDEEDILVGGQFQMSYRTAPNGRMHVFSDRGLYKPGESVTVKGWIRGLNDDAQLTLPGAGFMEVVALDIRWQPVWKNQVEVLDDGEFCFGLPLDATVTPGTVMVRLNFKGIQGAATFDVQEFRRPEFEVSTQVNDRCFVAGDEFPVQAKVAYYTGEPLANCELIWNVNASSGTFTPPGWPGFEFGRSSWRPWFFRSSQAEQELAQATFAATANGEGGHTLGIRVSGLEADASVQVTAEAVATDVQRQTFAGKSTVWVHPAAEFVGLKLDAGFVGRGLPLSGQCIVVDDAGKPVIGRAVEVILEFPDVDGVAQVVVSTRLESSEKPVEFQLQPPFAGSFSLTLQIQDGVGRLAKTGRAVWVAGAIKTDTNQSLERVELVAQKESWQVGETAHILVLPPFAQGSGIATLEFAGKIRKLIPFEFEGTHTLDIPIEATMVPGASLHVALVGARGPAPVAASHSIQLSVLPEFFRLQAHIQCDPPELEPGQSTEVTVHVQLPDGTPASGAHVTLWAVDESVLALAGYTTPDPLKMHARVVGYVRTNELRLTIPRVDDSESSVENANVYAEADMESSLGGAPMLPSSAPMMAMAPQMAPGAMPKRSASRSRGESEGSAPAPTGKPVYVRTDFSALAVFESSLVCDANGVVKTRIKVPDSLTRFRLMANVSSGVNHFGSNDHALVVRQALMVRPTKPRFLNLGDRAEFPVVIQNAVGVPVSVWVALRASNLETQTPGFKVELGARERREVRFPVSTSRPGKVVYQVVGRSEDHADAAQDTFDVLTPATRASVATSGWLDSAPVGPQAIRQELALPQEAYAEFGGLELRLSTTLLSGLTDLVVDVVRYPYSCAEQRASRVMTIALLKDFLPGFKGDDVPSVAQMNEAAQDDLRELIRLQQPDGGWGFWYAGKTYPVVTIHVVHALVEALRAGFQVDQTTLKRGLDYLDKIERHLGFWEYSAQTKRLLRLHAAWVRSRSGLDETARARAIFKAERESLSVDTLGWLLSIFSAKKSSDADEVFRLLNNRASFEGGKLQFIEGVNEVEQFVVLSSPRRSNAIALDALIEYKKNFPQSNEIRFAAIAQGLLAHKWKGNRTTQENTFVILGLMRYFREFEAELPRMDVELLANNYHVGAHHFEGRQTDIFLQSVPMAWMQSTEDENWFAIVRQGEGRLYWRANMRWAPQDLHVEAEDRGFSVRRVFEAVDDPADVVFEADGGWSVKAGARVRVRTTVVARKPRHHVALVSPIPAGFELLNPALGATERLPDESSRGVGADVWAVDGSPRGPAFFVDYWWRRWFDHQVLRDDRAEAFAASLWPGVHEHVVFARATMPGEFVVPPARAEEMYEPEVWGRGPSCRVVVR